MNSLPSSLGLIAGCFLLAGSTSNWAASISNKSTPASAGGRVSAGVYETIVSFGQSGPVGVQTSTHYTHGAGFTYYQQQSPTAGDQSVQANEDEALSLSLGASILDGNVLSYQIVESPSSGQLTGSPPQVQYLPSANYAGSDQFSYRITDGVASSQLATIEISVTALNDPPTASSFSVTLEEDQATSLTLLGEDTDGDTLTYTVLTQPLLGTLSGASPNLVYTPNQHAHGEDVFTYEVSDGQASSSVASVTLTLTPQNDAPSAQAGSVETQEDEAVSVVLGAQDVDGDSLTYEVVDAPLKGVLSGEGAQRVYTPHPDANGSDQFTFRVSDGVLTSSLALVQVSIVAVNDAPVAQAVSVEGSEDVPLAVLLVGSDVEGSSLSYQVVQAPQKGVLSGEGAQRTYTPELNYHGTDSFTYTVFDGELLSAAVSVTLTLQPVNDAPVAQALSVQGTEDQTLSVEVQASDVDGDALTFRVVQLPTKGVLSGTAPAWVYTPNAEANGDDAFTYTVSDGVLETAPVAVTLFVEAVNDGPLASDLSLSVDEDVSLSLVLVGEDVDGDALNYFVVTQPEHGVLSGTPPDLIYTPDANYNGSDGFTYQVSDGVITSAQATVSITVNPVADALVVQAQAVSLNEDSSQAITLVGSSPDAGELTYQIAQAPSYGILSGEAPNVIYTPDLNFNGEDSFVFKVSLNGATSQGATVALSVLPQNDAPSAQAGSVETQEDEAVSVVLGAQDVDGDSLTYEVVDAPLKGVLSGEGAQRVYTPHPDANGSDQFTFRVSDGVLTSSLALVQVSIVAVNDAPVAQAVSVEGSEDVPLAVLLVGSDVEGSSLSYQVVQAPQKGVLSGEGAQRTYTPELNYHGTDSFTYTVFDGELLSAAVSVTLTLQPVNDAPVAQALSVQGTEDQTLSVEVQASDVDGDALTFEWCSCPPRECSAGRPPRGCIPPMLRPTETMPLPTRSVMGCWKQPRWR